MAPTTTLTDDRHAVALLNQVIAANVREAMRELGMVPANGGATPRLPGKVTFTEREKRIMPAGLIRLAEAACAEWSAPYFSARRWIQATESAVYKLREAHPETALAFLLRKGVQTLANDWYTLAPREWQDYAGSQPSDGFAEFYAPLYSSSIAQRVERGERFPEGKVLGEDSVLVNYKFGLIEAFDRELFDDDQTGQIRQRAQRLGQSMAVTENAYAAIRLVGAAGSYQNLVVPASRYVTTDVNGNSVTTPFSTTLHGTYGNRPASFGALGLNVLKQAYANLLVAKDPSGNIIVTNPNTLVVSAMDSLHAPLLVSPPAGVPYYPAVVGSSGQTASSASSGFPGGVFGANPFMGLGIKPVVSRYLPAWAWLFGEKGKGFVFQERDPLEVIQENPLSGQAFEMDAYRFRSRRRFEADWVGGGSRHWWMGNDGSVTGAF